MKVALLIIIVLAMLAMFIGIFNKLIALIEAVRNSQKQIDIELDRRFKVLQNLIEVVKKYMDYEKTTLKDVTSLRNQAVQAKTSGNSNAQFAAEDQISKIAGSINVIFEQYPDLKADSNALHLQEEIVSTENRVAYAKQAYNDAIENYEVTRKSFVESFVVAMFRKQLYQEFNYWQLDTEQRQQKEDYLVKM